MTAQFNGTTQVSNEHAATGVDVTTEESRAALAKMVTRLFDLWELPGTAQAALLGLATTSRTSLSGYKNGKPLANTPDLLERVGHLLSIHKSLRILFPYDRDLAYSWITCPNRAFNGKSPLEVMLEYRFAGLLRVRAYLDFARGR